MEWKYQSLNDEANMRKGPNTKLASLRGTVYEEKIIELIKEFDETTLSVRSKNVLKNLNNTNLPISYFVKSQKVLKMSI